MSGQRRNAITLLEQISEDKVSFVLQILQGIQEVDSTAHINEKEEAYNRLENMRKKWAWIWITNQSLQNIGM